MAKNLKLMMFMMMFFLIAGCSENTENENAGTGELSLPIEQTEETEQEENQGNEVSDSMNCLVDNEICKIELLYTGPLEDMDGYTGKQFSIRVINRSDNDIAVAFDGAKTIVDGKTVLGDKEIVAPAYVEAEDFVNNMGSINANELEAGETKEIVFRWIDDAMADIQHVQTEILVYSMYDWREEYVREAVTLSFADDKTIYTDTMNNVTTDESNGGNKLSSHSEDAEETTKLCYICNQRKVESEGMIAEDDWTCYDCIEKVNNGDIEECYYCNNFYEEADMRNQYGYSDLICKYCRPCDYCEEAKDGQFYKLTLENDGINMTVYSCDSCWEGYISNR